MANNDVKMFMCYFANGMSTVMGAISKEDALNGVKAMEATINARLTHIEEMKDIDVTGLVNNLPEGNPQLTDGNEPDDDIDMGF